MGELRHAHHNVLTMILVVMYVLVGVSLLKWGLNKWPIPGLTQLVNFTFGGPTSAVAPTIQQAA